VGGSENWGHFGRPRAAGRTIRFWTFPCSGSSRKVKSLARQPASLVMFPLQLPVAEWSLWSCHFAHSRTAINIGPGLGLGDVCPIANPVQQRLASGVIEVGQIR
jgi:hypothetical protein